MKEESRYWFEQAQSDLRASQHSLVSRDFDWSCFQAQQAVEKSFKSLYLERFADLKKVHDLVFLAQKLYVPVEYIEFCVWLNKVYIEARYPDVGGLIPAKRFSEDDSIPKDTNFQTYLLCPLYI